MKHEIEVTSDPVSHEFGIAWYGWRAECTCGAVMVSTEHDAVVQMIDGHMAESLLGGNSGRL